MPPTNAFSALLSWLRNESRPIVSPEALSFSQNVILVPILLVEVNWVFLAQNYIILFNASSMILILGNYFSQYLHR